MRDLCSQAEIKKGVHIRLLVALALVILTSSALVEAAPLTTVQEQVVTPTDTTEKPVEPEQKTSNEVEERTVEEKVVSQSPAPKPKVQPKPTITGNKETWLRQSGIPESEWWAVDYIVSRESSWNPLAVNKSSGACGLAQALPCSKLGSNWYDPVHALKWQYQYVTARYGGYAQAYNFWVANHWY